MTAQASLFGSAGNAAIKPVPRHKPEPKQASPAEFVCAVKNPFGSPDKSGKYWYQRFGDDLRKLPEPVQKLVVSLTCDWPADDMESVRKMLVRFCLASIAERDDFQAAMGR